MVLKRLVGVKTRVAFSWGRFLESSGSSNKRKDATRLASGLLIALPVEAVEQCTLD